MTLQRMPLGYGPAPGPRQRPDGTPIDSNGVETLSAVLAARVPEHSLRELLPPPFELEEPSLILAVHRLRDVGWLAGRGYNIAELRIPAIAPTAQGPVTGEYVSVLWENRADPIITGREELGFAKIYGEIDDLCIETEPGPIIEAGAGWDGHRFLELRIEGLSATGTGASILARSRPRFHCKYIPATGSPGAADVAYPVLTPAEDPHRRRVAAWTGEGSFGFSPGSFEQLPTMLHIVNRLAAIPLLEFGRATVLLSRGGKSLRDQRPFRLACDGVGGTVAE